MAHNIIKYNDKLFVKSTKVKVFPCAYRGGRTLEIVGTKKRIAFQPTSRAFTEENWTTSNHGDGVKDSYLVGTSPIDNAETEVKCVVGGYAFVLQLTDDDLLVLAGGASTTLNVNEQESSRYLTISTIAQTMEDFTTTSPDVSHKTTILASRTNNKLEVLDQPISGDAGIDTLDTDGSKFIFTGLSIEDTKTASASAYYLAINKVDDEKLVWLNESYRLQNVLTTSTGANSVQTIDLDNTDTEIKESNVQKATGVQSVAFGYQSLASGEYSSTFGNKTTASGSNSSAFGTETTASGENSLSTGHNTEASGKNAISGGNSSEATAENSVALGYGTLASKTNQVVIGSCNTESDALFVIGNGTSTKKKNVLTVSKDGEMNLVNDTANKLNIGGKDLGTGEIHIGDDNFNVDSTGTVDFRGNLKIGTKDDEEFIFDPTSQKLVLKSSLQQTGDLSIGESESSYKAKISANTGTLDLADNTAELLIHAKADKNYFKVTSDPTKNVGTVTTDKKVIIYENLTANTITAKENLEVNKDLYITGNEQVNGYAKVSGTFAASGNVYLGKDEIVIIQNSSKEEPSSVQVNSDATISGNITIKSGDQTITTIDSKNFTVYPETIINNKLVTKDIVSSGNVELKTGNLTLNTGNITTKGDITATNAIFTKTNTESLLVGNTDTPIFEVSETQTDLNNPQNYITERISKLNNITISDLNNTQSISSKSGDALGSKTQSYYLSTDSFNVIQTNDSQLKMSSAFLLKNPNITLNAADQLSLQLNNNDAFKITAYPQSNTNLIHRIECLKAQLETPYLKALYSIDTDCLFVNSLLETADLVIRTADTQSNLLSVNKDEGIVLETTAYMKGEDGETKAQVDTAGNITATGIKGTQITTDDLQVNGAIKARGDAIFNNVWANSQLLGWNKIVSFACARATTSSTNYSDYMWTSICSLDDILPKPLTKGLSYVLQGTLAWQYGGDDSDAIQEKTITTPISIRVQYLGESNGSSNYAASIGYADISSSLGWVSDNCAIMLTCNECLTTGSPSGGYSTIYLDPKIDNSATKNKLVLALKKGSESWTVSYNSKKYIHVAQEKINFPTIYFTQILFV